MNLSRTYCFRDKQRLRSKVANYSHHRILYLELGLKSRLVGLPGQERNVRISSVVWIEYHPPYGHKGRPFPILESAGVRGLQEAWRPSPARRNQKPFTLFCVYVVSVCQYKFANSLVRKTALMTQLCVEEIVSISTKIVFWIIFV